MHAMQIILMIDCLFVFWSKVEYIWCLILDILDEVEPNQLTDINHE